VSSHVEHRTSGALPPALGLTAFVALLELGGGIAAHSLALVADSAHVFMDVVALVIAMSAQWQARRPATHRQTFGYARMEVLAALANAALLQAVTAFIVIEAIHRFGAPVLPSGKLMIAVALTGASINVFISFLLSREAASDLNVRAALYHAAGDAAGAIAVLIGGIVVLALGIAWIDPALSLFVAVLVVVGAAGIVREAAEVLLESTPAHIDLAELRRAMLETPAVLDVHDLHVWTLGACNHALSAHILVPDERVSACTAILEALDTRLRRDFDIAHVTMQFECVTCEQDERIVCTQPHRP
jgi:cobalt-zinc-cadmium efflux system protein